VALNLTTSNLQSKWFKRALTGNGGKNRGHVLSFNEKAGAEAPTQF
jgi:hypothetical protein